MFDMFKQSIRIWHALSKFWLQIIKGKDPYSQ